MKVKFFGALRERVECSETDVEMTADIDVAAIKQQLIARGGAFSNLKDPDIICAVNHDIVSETTVVTAGDEVAFFPPVTGG